MQMPMITDLLSHPPAAELLPRTYRLVDEQGNPHPILDDLYESPEAAWADACLWWQQKNQHAHDPIGIGIEVSTSCGTWRTIRHPCS